MFDLLVLFFAFTGAIVWIAIILTILYIWLDL